jgi:hypothetical protein
MLNPFFLNGTKTEQNLIQDLVNEQLRIYGVEVYYLPRQYVTEKTIIKEVIESKFELAYPIEAYVDSYDGYGGQGTILSKFGIQEIDDLTLIISKERFQSYISPIIKNLPDVKLSTRPKEGDLIYFPLGDRLFEIKYVEHEKPFYQLRENYVYELRCELFRYQDEDIDTTIDFIDDNLEEIGPIQTLQMVGIGVTASAITGIVNGGVRFVTVTNRGSGYREAPDVSFSESRYYKGTATGIATMIGGIVDICEPDPNLLRVQGVELTNPGRGYVEPPMVTFTGGGGSGAEAFATIGDGIIGIITVTDGGSGYINSPTVSFIGIASETAVASAILGPSGVVTEIRISNAGLGYTEAPQVVISSPSVITGVGTYLYNEVVVGSQSNVRAKVRSWNYTTKILEVSIISGGFLLGEILIGEDSGAEYTLQSLSIFNLSDPNDNSNSADKYYQNNEIQIESNKILDFSEKNPFGNP